METSDSEYFESADEEFFSEDDDKISQANTSRTKKSVSDEAKPGHKSTNEDKKSSVRELKQETSDLDITLSERQDSTSIEDLSVTESEFKSTRSKIEKPPPGVTACWEPGVDYFEEPNEEEKPVEKVEEPARKRTEFGVPPARVTCWVDGVNNARSSESEGHRQKPAGRKDEGLSRVLTERSEDGNKDRKRGVHFGEPPAREGCWEEGVNDIKQNSFVPKKTEEDVEDTIQKDAKPVESIKKTEKKEAITKAEDKEVITKAQEKETITKPEKEEPPKPTTTSPPKAPEEKEETVKPEENMWEEDDMWKDDSNWDTIAEKTNSSVSLDRKTSEANMWNDDEDWNNAPATQPKKEEDNMWEDDDWEPIENIPKQSKPTPTQEKKEDSGWGAWGNWGLSSVLNTATNITNQVSQSITTAIGAPDPEELARMSIQKEDGTEEVQEKPIDIPILGFGIGNIVQGVTKLVETTGTKVITGGLDTLETIGKKTMEVLQENDPGLKKKRAFLKLDDNKPILSQVLREAKERSEHETPNHEKKQVVKKPNYEALFDDHQGLVHLEALEMLSKQCDIKLSTLVNSSEGEALMEMQETMDQVKELCELPEDEEEESLSLEEVQERLESAVADLNINISYDRMISTWRKVEHWLESVNTTEVNCKDVHRKAIESLAQLTAIAVEQFHKAGELLLIKEHRSTADEADALVQLTTTLSTFIGTASGKFSEKLNMTIENGGDKDEINDLITNVFFEAANSSSYIKDAFQLLIPVLQVGAV